MRRRTVGSRSPSRAAGTGQAPTGTWIRSSVSRASWRASAASVGDARHGQRGHRPEHRIGRRRLDAERVGDEVATGDRQRMVGGHAPPASRRHRAAASRASSRSRRGVPGTRSGRPSRPSRTRGGSAIGRRARRWRRATRPAGGSARGGPRGPTGRPCPSARTATCGRCRSSRPRRARRRRPAPCPVRGRASTSVSMPRASSSATSSRTGRTSAGRAGDVADEHEPRARGHGGEDRGQRLIGPGDREGDPRDDDRRPVPRGHDAHRVDRRVVLVVVGQQLVARLEAQRLQHGVDAGRGVRHEGEALGIRPEEAPDRHAAPRPAGPAGRRTGTARAPPPAGRATPAGSRGPAPDRRRTSRG